MWAGTAFSTIEWYYTMVMLFLQGWDAVSCYLLCYSCSLYDPLGDLTAMKMLYIRSCVMPKKYSGGNMMTDLIMKSWNDKGKPLSLPITSIYNTPSFSSKTKFYFNG